MVYRITFRIKEKFYLELSSFEMMKLLGSTKSRRDKGKNCENFPLEITEVVLVHCNLINDNYQQNSRILYTFVSNK